MFRIGDFSRLTELSIRVLRHYDEIGLLSPAYTDPANGYRYYSADQLAAAHRIAALKDLGLTLRQVADMLHGRPTNDEIIGMLILEHTRAEAEHTQIGQRISELRRHLDELRDHGRLPDLEIVIKSIAPTPYLSHRTRARDTGAVNDLIGRIGAAQPAILNARQIVIVGHDDFFDTEDIDIEIGFPVGAPSAYAVDAHLELTAGVLPAIRRAATVITRGDPETGHRHAMRSLAMWLADHNERLDGPSREIIHDADILEIQFPITSAR